jgi:hypothetical protein
MNENKISFRKFWRSDAALMAVFPVVTVVLHLIAIEGFGYFRDEFYYITCSDKLSWGYVDHPPLAMLLLKVIRTLFGDSLVALRLLPALAHGVFVFGTGLLAKEMNANRFGIFLATAAASASLGNYFIYHVYSMNFLDQMFWLACIYIIIRIINTDGQNPKLWLWFGVTAGLGTQNKISVIFLCFGFTAGLLLTHHRKHLKTLYPWLAGAIAVLMFLPYIIWNALHNWPHLEFIRNAKMYKMSSISPLEFFSQQIMFNNPGTFLIWLAGLWYFFFHKKGKTYRLFGWMHLSIYILFTFQQAKDYYLAGSYPILFAGGATLIALLISKIKTPVLTNLIGTVVIISILIPTVIFIPVVLPLLPIDATARHIHNLGLTDQSGENHEKGILPQHYADMHGWPELTDAVATVYNALSPEEKKQCIIYTDNYGEAGAINFLGKKYNLPTAYSGHNNHYFWPPEINPGIVIITGGNIEDHLESFHEVKEITRAVSKYAMPYENNLPIFLCRNPRVSITNIWPSVKHFN